MIKKLLLTLLIGLTTVVSLDYIKANASANDFSVDSPSDYNFFEECLDFMFGDYSFKSSDEMFYYMENNEGIDDTVTRSMPCH